MSGQMRVEKKMKKKMSLNEKQKQARGEASAEKKCNNNKCVACVQKKSFIIAVEKSSLSIFSLSRSFWIMMVNFMSSAILNSHRNNNVSYEKQFML